jgi:hypothetical protein
MDQINIKAAGGVENLQGFEENLHDDGRRIGAPVRATSGRSVRRVRRADG